MAETQTYMHHVELGASFASPSSANEDKHPYIHKTPPRTPSAGRISRTPKPRSNSRLGSRDTSKILLRSDVLGSPSDIDSSIVDVDVVGKERSKYFAAPIGDDYEVNPKEQAGDQNQFGSMGSNPLQIGSRHDSHRRDNMHSVRFATPPHSPVTSVKMKDAECQTMYRDSEAQTDPYSPPYVLKDTTEEESEIIQLQKMGIKWGNGLPAGKDEIELIERARQKRNFEESLPALTDEYSFELRRKMLEEQELLDWEFRAKEIKKEQLQKLELVKHAVHAKEVERELMSNYKVEAILNRTLEIRDSKRKGIHSRRIQKLRKLVKERENVEGKLKRRDIVEDYANYSSQVYAPRTREGRKRETLILEDIKPPSLAYLGGIESLEARIHRLVKTPAKGTRALKKFAQPKTTSIRQEMDLVSQLELLNQSIRKSKAQNNKKLPRPSVAEKIEKPPPRPPTPTLDKGEPEDIERLHAIILLQKLIRGRAIQNLMYEGKTRRLELINELKSADNYRELKLTERDSSTQTIEQAPEDAEDTQKARDEIQAEQLGKTSEERVVSNTNPLVESTLEEILGSVIGDGLDFLSKELVRVREERRIAALVNTAERTRRMREAEESGRRHVEELLRKREDVQYQQIMRAHQQTASNFLEAVIEDAANAIAQRRAAEEEKLKAQRERELALMPFSPEKVINDLIFGSLFPLVEKECSKDKASQENKKYAKAAKDALLATIPKVEEQLRLHSSQSKRL